MTALSTIVGRGIFSARPAAGTAGATYYDTTNTKIWRDNGTTWDDVTPSASVSDATTSTVGGVEVDHAPSGSHPVALTTDGTSIPSGMLGAHTWTGNQTAPALIASGLTGATDASRYVGATASGAPTSGTFAVGDFIIDQTGKVYVCTSAGTPGTWAQAGGGSVFDWQEVALTSSAAMSGSTWTDLLSLALAQGTWVVESDLQVVMFGSQPPVFRLLDGAGTASRTMTTFTTGTARMPMHLKQKMVVPSGGWTVKVQYNAAGVSGASVEASDQAPGESALKNTSWLYATRYA